MTKRRYEKINLNGVSFTYDNKLSHEPIMDRWCYADIFDAYNRPSHEKELIWRNWQDWFLKNHGYCWIESKNTFQFTITGYVINNKTGEILGVHITSHNHICWSISY